MTVIGLTKHEWWVIGIIAALLFTGWLTKIYRASHPVPATLKIQSAKS